MPIAKAHNLNSLVLTTRALLKLLLLVDSTMVSLRPLEMFISTQIRLALPLNAQYYMQTAKEFKAAIPFQRLQKQSTKFGRNLLTYNMARKRSRRFVILQTELSNGRNQIMGRNVEHLL